ncbi:hypothetical protein EON66_08645, partial [archaeon]
MQLRALASGRATACVAYCCPRPPAHQRTVFNFADSDVYSNYGNWTYVAGVGSDPREDRYFLIPKQARDYDAKGEYMRTWLPELRDAPADQLQDPRRLTALLRGSAYPLPVVKLLAHREASAGYGAAGRDSAASATSAGGRPERAHHPHKRRQGAEVW